MPCFMTEDPAAPPLRSPSRIPCSDLQTQFPFLTALQASAPPSGVPATTLMQIAGSGCGATSLPSQLSSSLYRRPTGVSLNLSNVSDVYTEEGHPCDVESMMQLSPASSNHPEFGSPSPTSASALFTLRQFLPSNLERDRSDAFPYDMCIGDEFRMYAFKVRKCTRGRSHDWTECPFLHPGEKARRRDPRRYNYSGDPCPDYRKGSCKMGDACKFAHGVFESWLHPTRYRTQPCKDGRGCQRRICFFAHTADQLRATPQTPFSFPSTSPSLSLSPSPLSPTSASTEALPDMFEVFSPFSDKYLSSPMLYSPPLPSSPLCVPNIGEELTGPCISPASLHRSFSLRSRSSQMAHINEKLLHSDIEPHRTLSFRHGCALIGAQNFIIPEREQSFRSTYPLSCTQGLAKAGASISSPLLTHGTDLSHDVDNLRGLLKQVNLDALQHRAAHEHRQAVLLSESFARGTPTSEGNRARDEIMKYEHFFCKEGEIVEPQIERVESGRGIRAQIFENLLNSVNSNSESGH
ncbi:hypothetical protein KP509_07G046400 [Ceratopteris richardii]|uniref:C3H1-type domain-containing protein n=1 Tax=Ceratopteris richardii TaxID=49495 RepID=A0A8T2UKU8_CERRI|nr:hypothetical protein KP509_07G046400 [Ceratopteris richardii]